ncbi:MAG: Rho termination factor N-terminal domain-containing protein, partial [Flavobacteriaceae bacterium]
MFEIETLKAKKLADLQEIAATLKIARYKTLKKQDLIYQILDLQAQKPEEVAKHEIKEKSSKEESTGTEAVNEDHAQSKRRPRTRTQKTPGEGVSDEAKQEVKSEGKEEQTSENTQRGSRNQQRNNDRRNNDRQNDR